MDISLNLARRVLTRIIEVYCALIEAALPDTKQALRLSLTLSRHVRRNLKIIDGLHGLSMRRALESNPGFRAQVRADLGGTAAMKAWQERRRGAMIRAAFRAANGLPEPDYTSPHANGADIIITSDTRSPHKSWQPKTDRSGTFRLKVIKIGARAAGRKPVLAKHPTRSKRRYRVRLIEVTPGELRTTPNIAPDRWAELSFGNISSGHTPPFLRPPR